MRNTKNITKRKFDEIEEVFHLKLNNLTTYVIFVQKLKWEIRKNKDDTSQQIFGKVPDRIYLSILVFTYIKY